MLRFRGTTSLPEKSESEKGYDYNRKRKKPCSCGTGKRGGAHRRRWDFFWCHLFSILNIHVLSVFYSTLVLDQIFYSNLLIKGRSKKMPYIYPVASRTSFPLLNISVCQTWLVSNQYLLSPSYQMISGECSYTQLNVSIISNVLATGRGDWLSSDQWDIYRCYIAFWGKHWNW